MGFILCVSGEFYLSVRLSLGLFSSIARSLYIHGSFFY